MNKYLRAISANVLYFLINTVFFLVITPISIHIMGPEFFGLWSILNAIVFITGVGTLGIGSIVNKFAAEVHESEAAFQVHSSEVVSAGILIVLPMSILTACILAFLRFLIANNLDISLGLQRQFAIALLLVAVAIFPQFLSRIPQGFLLSQYRNELARRIETIYLILLWGGAVLISLYRKDLVWIAFWCLTDGILLLVMYIFAIQQITNIRFRFNPILARRMLGFSGFMFFESVAITLFQQMDRVIVGFVLGPVMAGIYAVGTSVGLRMSLVTGQVTDLMIPYASLKDSANDSKMLYVVFRKLSSYISLLIAGLGGILIVWMNEILSLWISADYATKYSLMFRILIVGYSLLSLSRPAHQTLTGIGKVKITSFIYSASTVAMLISLYFLALRFGMIGAALANCVPVLLLVMNFYAYRKLSDTGALKQMFRDLKWGAFLPTLTFILVYLFPIIWLKILLTLILGCFVAVILIKDEWAQPWLVNQVKNILNRLVSYA